MIDIKRFSWSRLRWWSVRVLGGVAVVLVAYLALTPTGHYLVRAGWEEGKILAHRRPIAAIIDDPATPGGVRAKLRVVLEARGFAADSVGLKAKQSFTTYSKLDRDTLVLVLSGAWRDRLEPYTWWFPIVGRVPYKGYFDFAQAKRAAKELTDRGFDSYLRPSPAFSTLGWFNDPLLSTSLRSDSLDLANTVIHELTHNTFYAPGQAVFNESFANFVGARGAAWFFRTRGDSLAAARVDDEWEDDKLLAGFWDQLYKSLDSAFKAHPGKESAAVRLRLAIRDSTYHAARQDLVYALGPRLRTVGPRYLERVRLDNAALLARRIYLTELGLFDAVWEREGRDLRKTIATVIRLAKDSPDDPYGALRKFVGG